MKIQYIKGTKNIPADCLLRLVDTKLTNCDCDPKGQEFRFTTFEELSPMEVFAIYNLLDTWNLEHLQENDVYFRCIHKSLHIPSVQKQFLLDSDTIYGWTQDRANILMS